MRHNDNDSSPYPVDPLLGARVCFTDKKAFGWPRCEGIVVDTQHSLIVRADDGVHIVPRDTVRIVRTVLQGEVFW